MEVVAADNNHEFLSRLCSDDSDEQLSKPSDAAVCSISVHKRRHIVSADVGIVEKREQYIADTPDHCVEVVPFTLPPESYTDANVVDIDMAEGSQSTCTNDCALSVTAVTTELANSAISMSDAELAEPQCTLRPKSLYSAKKAVCFPVDDADSSADQSATDDGKCIAKLESKRMSLLLRLFESKLFDMAIALPYLFNSKEPGVLAYLGQYLISDAALSLFG